MKNRIFYQSNINKSNEVTYIMTSSFRILDNHSLQYALNEYDHVNVVIYYLLKESVRNRNFILPYLMNLSNTLKTMNITVSFYETNTFISNIQTDVILDKSYLNEYKNVEKEIVNHIEKIRKRVSIIEDNVLVPAHVVTDKEEYSARTIRPKIWKHFYDYINPIDSDIISKGEQDALDVLKLFIEDKLRNYHLKNHPDKDYTSLLSPFLKYGLISPIRIIHLLEGVSSENKDSFIEELIIRRELSYNFVEFNQSYNSFDYITYDWAYQTMNIHMYDHKEYIYTIDDYINFKTHDPYFNAAMEEMVFLGRMHGYMRMYWCKKIIEWSTNYKKAYEIAIALNNRYFLDGNTPNGYTGVAWCFGKHDRAWTERPIFGKLRYMNANGLKRKFDIENYVRKINEEVKSYENI